MTSTRLFLIDSDYRRRAAITHMLEGGEFHIEPFEDIDDFASRLPGSGIVLVHDEDGLLPGLLEHFNRSRAWLPYIAYSEEPDTARVVKAIRGGALDYLPWPAGSEAIAAAVSNLGEAAQPLLEAQQRKSDAWRRIERLTGREREVLAGVANGLSNRSIAQTLGISPRTVEIHRSNMLTKLQASNSPDAVRIAIDAGLPL